MKIYKIAYKKSFEILDTDFNKKYFPDSIGKITTTPPPYANVKMIEERKTLEDIAKSTEDINLFIFRSLRENHKTEEIIKAIEQLYNKPNAKQIFNDYIIKKHVRKEDENK